MNREMNIQVNFHEYLPKNITIQMNMNFDFSQFKWIWILIFPIRVELNIRKISKNTIQFESIQINSNRFESNVTRVGALSICKIEYDI
jgi:hypothetical protein